MNAETKVSAKGQIVIPKEIRDDLDWPAGTRLQVEKVGDAVTMRPVKAVHGTLTAAEFVARRPKFEGPSLSLEEIERRLLEGMKARFTKDHRVGR